MRLSDKTIREIKYQLLLSEPYVARLEGPLAVEILCNHNPSPWYTVDYSSYVINCFLFLLEAHDASDV